MPTTPLSDKQEIIPLMAKIGRELKALVIKELRKEKIDLSKNQAVVLNILSSNDGLVQNDLAFITARDKTSLTRLLNLMESKNLIYRVKNAEDKRINHVFLTEYGRSEHIKTAPVLKSVINQAIDGIPEKEIADAKILLNKIYHNLNRENE